ncbi:hypothetical protein CP532_4707 [Ophiocordyceps camponoti-leonardi (nom. inval.)]|nr:hypothetical protein CP532_4707 [Ophiocordyceps camponoti-leonardi (nom. inval.)]
MTVFWEFVVGLFWLLAYILIGLPPFLLSSLFKLAAFFLVNVFGHSPAMIIGAILAYLVSPHLLTVYLVTSFRAFCLAFVCVALWTVTGHPVFPTMFLLLLLLLQVDPRDPAPTDWTDAAYTLAQEIALALPLVLCTTEIPHLVVRALSPILRFLARSVLDILDDTIEDLTNAESSDEQLPPSVTTGVDSSTQTSSLLERLQLIRDRDGGRLSPQDQRRLTQLECLIEEHTAEYESILGSAPSRSELPRTMRTSSTFSQESYWPHSLARLPRRQPNDEGDVTKQHSQSQQQMDAMSSCLAANRDAAGAVLTEVAPEPTVSADSESDGEAGHLFEVVEPESSQEIEGETQDTAADPSDIGGEAVETQMQPELHGDWVPESFGVASDGSSQEHGAVEAPGTAQQPDEIPLGGNADFFADHPEAGGEDPAPVESDFFPAAAAATPQTLGGADSVDVPPQATTTLPSSGEDELMTTAVAGVSRGYESSSEPEGRSTKRLRNSQPSVTSPGGPSGQSSSDAVPAADCSMEWEATGSAIPAAEDVDEPEMMIIVDDDDNESDQHLVQVPMDFREAMDVQDRDDDDDEMEYSWTWEGDVLDLEGVVGQAEEDGSLDDLTAALQRCTLQDDEELDVAMTGEPEVVLEVVQDGHRETAPQESSSLVTLESLLHDFDVEMAENLVFEEPLLQQEHDWVQAYDNSTGHWDVGDESFDEGQFAALLDEGLHWDTSTPNLQDGSGSAPVAGPQETMPPLDFGSDFASALVGESTLSVPDGQEEPQPQPMTEDDVDAAAAAAAAAAASNVAAAADQPPQPDQVPESTVVPPPGEDVDNDAEFERAMWEALTNFLENEEIQPPLASSAGAGQFEASTAPIPQVASTPQSPPPEDEETQPAFTYPSPSQPSQQQPASPDFQPSPPHDGVSASPVGGDSVDEAAVVGELFLGPPPGTFDAEEAETEVEVDDDAAERDRLRVKEREPVINTAHEIAQRPKLLPRSRRLRQQQQQQQQAPSAISQEVATLPDHTVAEEIHDPKGKGKGKERATADTFNTVDNFQSGPGSCPIPIDPQLWATYDAPHDDNGTGLQASSSTSIGPSTSAVVPSIPATLPTSQVTGSSAAGGSRQSQEDTDKTPRKQKAPLTKKKPSLFHAKKTPTAPSTPYGTRAPGSAERERQFRSSQTLDGMDRMALDETDGEPSQPLARQLAIAPISFVKQRPPEE